MTSLLSFRIARGLALVLIWIYAISIPYMLFGVPLYQYMHKRPMSFDGPIYLMLALLAAKALGAKYFRNGRLQLALFFFFCPGASLTVAAFVLRDHMIWDPLYLAIFFEFLALAPLIAYWAWRSRRQAAGQRYPWPLLRDELASGDADLLPLTEQIARDIAPILVLVHAAESSFTYSMAPAFLGPEMSGVPMSFVNLLAAVSALKAVGAFFLWIGRYQGALLFFFCAGAVYAGGAFMRFGEPRLKLSTFLEFLTLALLMAYWSWRSRRQADAATTDDEQSKA